MQFHSSRGLASGGSIQTSSVGLEAFFYNPAGFAFEQKPFQDFSLLSPMVVASDVVKKYILHPGEIKVDGEKDIDLIKKYQSTAIFAEVQNLTGLAGRNFAIGMFTNVALEVRFFTEPQDLLPSAYADASIYNGGLFALYERFFGERLLLGATAKIFNLSRKEVNISADEAIDIAVGNEKFDRDKMIGSGVGTGFGKDIGAIWRTRHRTYESRLGLSLVNAGGIVYQGLAPPPAEIQLINAEASLIKSIGTHTAVFSGAINDVENITHENNFKRLHLGWRWLHNPYISLMVGLNQGYPTFGVSLGRRIIYLDIAHYGVELGTKPGYMPDQRTAIQLRLGWVF